MLSAGWEAVERQSLADLVPDLGSWWEATEEGAWDAATGNGQNLSWMLGSRETKGKRSHWPPGYVLRDVWADFSGLCFFSPWNPHQFSQGSGRPYLRVSRERVCYQCKCQSIISTNYKYNSQEDIKWTRPKFYLTSSVEETTEMVNWFKEYVWNWVFLGLKSNVRLRLLDFT